MSLDTAIAHGERFYAASGDPESAELLGILRSYKRLREAAEALIRQYETMPDGTLGHGLTNGHFFAVRDALHPESNQDGSNRT